MSSHLRRVRCVKGVALATNQVRKHPGFLLALPFSCAPHQDGSRVTLSCAVDCHTRTHAHALLVNEHAIFPGQVEEIRAKKQEEWEKKRKAEDPIVRPEEPQDNSALLPLHA